MSSALKASVARVPTIGARRDDRLSPVRRATHGADEMARRSSSVRLSSPLGRFFGSYRRTWEEDVPSWQAERVDLVCHPRAIVAATDYQPLDDAVPGGARRRSRLSH
ncbi:hypothetical protein ACQR1Y_00830 [Bradyrhizobium sp. HKCCYLRH3099]|uniref:hypothetical protein n=1 Tax=unclassified Bradyrhizobium TaxID=2631580 RepID=UPI003EBE5A00